MDRGKLRICAFCTNSIAYKGTRVGAYGVVQQFFNEFVISLGGGGGEGGDCGDGGNCAGSSRRALRKKGEEKLPENWAVCNECLPSVQGVLARKEKVNRVEGAVRRLQVQLLKELNGLAREVTLMCEEMKVVEGIVAKGGSEQTKPGGYEDSSGGADGGGEGRTIRRRKGTDDELISSFRDKVVNVLRDWEYFKRTTSDKLLTSSNDSSPPPSKIPERQRGKPRGRHVRKASVPSTAEMAPTTSRNVERSEANAEETQEEDANDNIPDVIMEDVAHDDHPSPVPDAPEDVDDRESPAEEEPVPAPVVRDTKHEKTEKRTRAQTPKKDQGGSDRESWEDSSSEEEKDRLSDEDFDPQDLTTQIKSITNRKPLKSSSLFKRNLIATIKERRSVATSKYLPNSKRDPRRKYSVMFNAAKDKFFVDSVEIICLDDQERLQCSECPEVTFKSTPHTKAEHLMFDHILAHHLNAYICKICDKKFLEPKTFLHHKSMHDGDHTCDICGRPFARPENLLSHKWKHLNETEKEDPANAHLVPRRLQHPDLYNTRRFQCTICGRAFKLRKQLKVHEETHKSMEEREKTMCPDCGALVLRNNFHTHQLNCSRRHLKGIHCPVCDTFIKYRKWLDKHLKQEHPDVRLYSCDVCGKNFRTKTDLKHHKMNHSEVEACVCRYCGMGMKMRKNLGRHEKRCRENPDREDKACRGNDSGLQDEKDTKVMVGEGPSQYANLH